MKRVVAATVFILSTLVLPGLCAVRKPQYQAARIVDVQHKAHTRVLYYLVNTPVTQDDPYYEISLQVGTILYVVEYTPVHDSQMLPEDWKPGATVQARVQKHAIYLLRAEGTEVKCGVIRHSRTAP
jgi:hypothetical protein